MEDVDEDTEDVEGLEDVDDDFDDDFDDYFDEDEDEDEDEVEVRDGYIIDDDDEEDEEDESSGNAAPSSGNTISSQALQISHQHSPPTTRSRRRRGPRMSRAERQADNLYTHHPELKYIWDALEKLPKIAPKEVPQPDGLKLTLLPFQREGLNWLEKQEKGAFKGGILADEMGMGKTIQTIALLMTEPDTKPNLVVAPTVALMQWKSEIQKHTAGRLSVCIHHGPSRLTDAKEIAEYHVVLTTYNILESDFRKQQTGFKRKAGVFKEDSAIHQVNFHRVILDEAHNIKDRSCNTAKAVYALKTRYKLCLSGTPLQNRIGELFSLLRFLEIDPFAYYYCSGCACKNLYWKFSDGRHCDSCGHSPMHHLSFFNWSLLKPIQQNGHDGPGRKAFENIHKLLKLIMLRRTKTEREEDLGLPPKVVKIRRDRFSEEEMDLYDSIYSDGKRKFDYFVAQGVVLNNYANIFTLITRMRQMANHPDLVLRKTLSDDCEARAVCPICISPCVDAIESKCHHIFCRDCISSYLSSFPGRAPDCPKCHVDISIDLSAPEIDTPAVAKNSGITSRINHENWRSSTKIEALCAELHRLRTPYSSPKSIVFSQFTSFLSLLEFRLNSAGFKTVLLQGNMTPTQREASINHFTDTPDVEVFLVSLQAGGVALNLIEANNVFIMEPWWNPAVQWQAADRIHRIGQKRMCTVTYLIVDGSIEGRILELQEKKKRLIESTVDADQKAMEKLTVADMQFLFQN
ncbi:hypothetical protein EX30DRAFT_310705 [Ascodesmis nigricans]|uniref:Uncharacterized protein n=1 Tax=Ascodesmis nigricans TaxID=341454 RepID=A0A4S2MRN1_9PEZI|nr:hypothetical protein EX30DRAFT_310705 [Ascodesmis nigricans]